MYELKRFAIAWNLMWGLSYIIVAVIAPWISDVSNIFYAFLGAWILLSLGLLHLAHDKLDTIVRVMFLSRVA
jgi:drug/metabolite transporter (DMT)-like permease